LTKLLFLFNINVIADTTKLLKVSPE